MRVDKLNYEDLFRRRFGVDVDHVGLHDVEDPQLQALGYGPNDQAHSMWSFPVSIAANYHF